MSFCPTKDIHSIYLDNEMPENYKAEYEAHVKNCPSCQKELEKIRTLRELFETDAQTITPDNHYLDESYERLMIKMSYAKNTKKSDENKFKTGIRYFVPTAAAAAAVFAIVLPLKSNLTKNTTVPVQNIAHTSQIVSQMPAATNVSVGGGTGMVISGNINELVLPSNKGHRHYPNGFSQNFNPNNPYNYNFEGNFIPDFDVFKPDFDESKTIPIKITIPGMNSVSPVSEFELFENVAGQSE